MSFLPRWLIRYSAGARWFARVRSDQMSQSEDKAFVAWLEQDETNARSYASGRKYRVGSKKRCAGWMCLRRAAAHCYGRRR
jgi:ferric-dicitrate binding protein FerR (iron transport regulator)